MPPGADTRAVALVGTTLFAARAADGSRACGPPRRHRQWRCGGVEPV
ncbi:hypothetical protein [Streptomyces sp. SudanB182_2057]